MYENVKSAQVKYLRVMQEEQEVACFKALSGHSPGETEG
jgi:hypothetical protein